ncbi:NDP-sugar synthase [Actinomadura miaoliensis]|uniref:NDP-sugar synthase n=1 Tax=Actinomadura miaoliensis TaxID=430685 RepID=A0ABP7VJR6_9ACTN
MTQAIVLAGGKGTRLRPMTVNIPKPMLPVGGVPYLAHLMTRAAAAGVDRMVLATCYLAEVFEPYFGDGSRFGLRLEYAVEEEPLGTGGAIRFAADRLTCGPAQPVLVFNGDVLSGADLPRLLDRHRTAAADVTLLLTRVADPRAFGLVPTGPDGAVQAFLEKPRTPEEIVTDQINAGCYVFTRSVIDRIPAGVPVSVERETFPGLLADDARVFGVVDPSYWLDLGVPAAFVRASADLVRGVVTSAALPGPPGESLVLRDAVVDVAARPHGGTCVGPRAIVGASAEVEASVIMADAVIGPGAVVRRSVIGVGARIGAGAVLEDAVVGDYAQVAPDMRLGPGTRVEPGAPPPSNRRDDPAGARPWSTTTRLEAGPAGMPPAGPASSHTHSHPEGRRRFPAVPQFLLARRLS